MNPYSKLSCILDKLAFKALLEIMQCFQFNKNAILIREAVKL
jgi:hypothetical protein